MNALLDNIEATKQAFRRAYGYTPPHVVPAPGRIELLGNHTDYCQGLVLAATIDRYIILAGAPRTDGIISVYSALFDEKETFSRTNLDLRPAPHWLNYIKGLLAVLRHKQISFPGLDLAVGGNLTAGAGLASSAALLVGLALLIHRLAPFPLAAAASAARPQPSRRRQPPPLTSQENLALAQLCHRAEVEFVGLNCGILDQLACVFGKEAHGLEIDCQSHSVAPWPLYGQACWVLCDSGVRHELTDGAYNEIRKQCNQAAAALGQPSLRRLDLSTLKRRRTDLTQRQHECAQHILSENQRVLFGVRALREGDLDQFGQYLFQSHESSRTLLRNSCPELDLLVDLARSHSGCLGARLTGGGFGGATIHLVRADQVQPYRAFLEERFNQSMGYIPQTEICRIVDGAGATDPQA